MLRRTALSLIFVSVLATAASGVMRPKLVVVVTVDQFSAELMQTYGPELTRGLALLRKEGVFFTEAYHDHAFTDTGPGNSVLLSGRFPASTGIVENTWFDRAIGKVVYCVEDAAARSLTAPGKVSASNARFLGDGLGDWLQAQVPGSRVFSVSGKDRAAILMSGRRPTGVFWFMGSAGFTSSTAYTEQLPAWLVLSADLGGLDFPEALSEQGFPAHRLLPEPFMAALQADLRGAFNVERDLVATASKPNNIYLDESALTATGLDRHKVLKRAQAWLRARSEIADAFTAEELQATGPVASGSPRSSNLSVLLRRSFLAERSGDLLVAVKPFVVVGTPPASYPAGHGTPNAYDRRVPLIFCGPRKGGDYREPVRTVDLAPTLARELGLRTGVVDGMALDPGPRK
jgi:predicted AlkP superfamily pyrophosphatase or phosphodiesterase